MIRAVVLLSLLATPAWALQEPTPGDAKKGDPHVCTAPFQPGNMLHVRAKPGDNITLQFADDDRQGGTGLSDSVTLKRLAVDNIVMLKATGDMPAQPITIRMVRPEGAPHIHMILWETADATPCYSIRFTYAGEATAAQRAAWLARQQQARARAAEAALAAPQLEAVNTRYSMKGDSRLLPQGKTP